ncbi:MAG: peptidoglycan-binding domain-containing protein [Chthoniobacterales bacterium]
MKKFTTLVISCSLALVAGAMAQQDDAQQPTPNKKQKQHERAQARQERGTNAPAAAKASEAVPRGHKGRAATNVQHEQNTPATTNARTHLQPGTQTEGHRANRKARSAAMENKNIHRAPVAEKTNAQAAKKANAQNAGNQATPNKGGKTRTPDAQVVQKIKTEHSNFHAQARPQQVPSVTFKNNYRITNSQHWQGEHYAAFRNYHPERHDRGWYRTRYNRIELIGGGYYYFNAGYWYPAFGYAPEQSYYAYNGPIYVGQQAEPPDRVIADVQATLQDMGYYKGEVDGLLGPLTREALTGYQSDNGLYTTAAIDQPTLDSLGLSS